MEFERGIWYAAQHGDLERVEVLARRGVDVRDRGGYTALHYAARNGHVAVCKLLLRKGADANAKTRSGGATALHRAASAGKLVLQRETYHFIKHHPRSDVSQRLDNLLIILTPYKMTGFIVPV